MDKYIKYTIHLWIVPNIYIYMFYILSNNSLISSPVRRKYFISVKRYSLMTAVRRNNITVRVCKSTNYVQFYLCARIRQVVANKKRRKKRKIIIFTNEIYNRNLNFRSTMWRLYKCSIKTFLFFVIMINFMGSWYLSIIVLFRFFLFLFGVHIFNWRRTPREYICIGGNLTVLVRQVYQLKLSL